MDVRWGDSSCVSVTQVSGDGIRSTHYHTFEGGHTANLSAVEFPEQSSDILCTASQSLIITSFTHHSLYISLDHIASKLCRPLTPLLTCPFSCCR